MRALTLAMAMAAALVAAACSDDPTSPAERLVFTGVVSATGGGEHAVSLGDAGNLRVTLTEVRPLLLDVTTVDPATLSFALGLGSPGSDGCELTYSASFVQGSVASFGLAKGDYCLTFTDSSLPEDSTVAYTLSVEVND